MAITGQSDRDRAHGGRLTEEEFIAQYKDPIAKIVARDLYRETWPTGMHTNGPVRIRVEGSHLHRLLSKWKNIE